MKRTFKFFSAAVIFVATVQVGVQAGAVGLSCAFVFNGEKLGQMDSWKTRSYLDGLLLLGLTQFPVLRRQTIGDRVIAGRVGASEVSFDEHIDFRTDFIDGLSTRLDASSGRYLLDVFVRPQNSPADLFRAPLASEMDSLSFFVAGRFGLSRFLDEDPRTGTYFVSAGETQATTPNSIGVDTITLGSEWTIAGLSNRRLPHEIEVETTLLIQNVGTKKIYAVKNRTEAQGLKALKALMNENHPTLVIEGNTFGVAPRGFPITRAK